MIPTIFISSTIEDLHHVRDAIRETISELGYQPIMSERGGVGFWNGTAADVACYQSVKECQLMILIIGKRYGSKTDASGSVSVTEHEYDTCMEHRPRLITFVDGEVLNFKKIFDENPTARDVTYPGMDNATATFSFIDKVRNSPVRNAIIPFASVSDVRSQLKQQLALLFHDLLDEHSNPEKSVLDEIMVEVKTIRNALSKKAAPDMRFLTVFKFLLDDQYQDFSKFIKSVVEEVEVAIPIICDSANFDVFAKTANITVKVINEPDCFSACKGERNLIYGATFMPAHLILGHMQMPHILQRCSYAIDSNRNVVMNNSAHDYFMFIYGDLKKRLSKISDAKD